MDPIPPILLLDDGELDDVAALLQNFELEYTRLRGGEILSDVPAPLDLVVATPRRASSVLKASPAAAKPGRPTRIVVTEEDSNSMRKMLRRAGFHLLVRRPTHPEIWRLLVQRAIYQGEERRSETRMPVGSDVQLDAVGDDQLALLLDISGRGCRLSCDEALSPGSVVMVSIPCSPADGMSIELEGEIIRCVPSGGEGVRFDAALRFSDLAEEARERLTTLLNVLEADSGSHAPAQESVDPPPAVPNEEATKATEDSVVANIEVCVRSERRQKPRAPFAESVLAMSGGESSVVMGRDLSAGGMRVERLPDLHEGDRLTLGIYAPGQADPLRVSAVVHRDDAQDGLALRFEKVSDETCREIEKLVAALPDVESLDRSESESMGAVLGEIIDQREAAAG